MTYVILPINQDSGNIKYSGQLWYDVVLNPTPGLRAWRAKELTVDCSYTGIEIFGANKRFGLYCHSVFLYVDCQEMVIDGGI